MKVILKGEDLDVIIWNKRIISFNEQLSFLCEMSIAFFIGKER